MTASPVTQPVPRPHLRADYLALIDAGVLVDLAGRLLRWRSCPYCGEYPLAEGVTCPIQMACPSCDAPAGRSRCRRPSGHDTASLHTGRVQAAHRRDEERIAAGDLSLPAPWPPDPTPPAANHDP